VGGDQAAGQGFVEAEAYRRREQRTRGNRLAGQAGWHVAAPTGRAEVGGACLRCYRFDMSKVVLKSPIPTVAQTVAEYGVSTKDNELDSAWLANTIAKDVKGIKISANDLKGIGFKPKDFEGIKISTRDLKGLGSEPKLFAGIKVGGKDLINSAKVFEGIKIEPRAFEGIKISTKDFAGMKIDPKAFEGIKIDPKAFEGIKIDPKAFEGIKLSAKAFEGMKIDPKALEGMKKAFEGMKISMKGFEGIKINPKEFDGIKISAKDLKGIYLTDPNGISRQVNLVAQRRTKRHGATGVILKGAVASREPSHAAHGHDAQGVGLNVKPSGVVLSKDAFVKTLENLFKQKGLIVSVKSTQTAAFRPRRPATRKK
jgi:hypothetical protein